MKIIRTYQALKQERALINGKLSFVPTMGALHDGHLHLVKEAKKYAKNVIVSIFVNPTQFGKNEDFSLYPHQIEDDIKKLQKMADYLYIPQISDIYPSGKKITIKAGSAANGLCADFRPSHFDGVCTVVSILFTQIQPDYALFGEKDYQQLMVIKEMAKEHHPLVNIIGVPTIREKDGLAMSSRNVYLTTEERKLAPALYNELRNTTNLEISKHKLENAGFKVQYLTQKWNRIFVAAYLGKTRLIDNVESSYSLPPDRFLISSSQRGSS